MWPPKGDRKGHPYGKVQKRIDPPLRRTQSIKKESLAALFFYAAGSAYSQLNII